MIRLGAVGDVVRALGSVAPLRRERPDVRLGWLVGAGARALIEGNPAVDEAFVLEARGRQAGGAQAPLSWLGAAVALRRRLRAARFDVALDLQGTLKSAAWALGSGARRRLGFARGVAREGAWLFMSDRVRPPASARSRLQQFDALARALAPGARPVQPEMDGAPSQPGSTGPGGDRPAPPVPLPDLEARRQSAAGWLAERALDRKPWVLLCPGCSRRQQFKRWPAARFAEVGRRLAARGAGVVIGWGPGEEGLAEEVEQACLGGAVRAPAGDLLDLAALASLAGALVGNDSGPIHLAWALGTPVVSIFGPTDPELNAPPGPQHTALYAGPPRRAGERRPRRPLYLDRIRPDEVESAVMRTLERAGAHRA